MLLCRWTGSFPWRAEPPSLIGFFSECRPTLGTGPPGWSADLPEQARGSRASTRPEGSLAAPLLPISFQLKVVIAEGPRTLRRAVRLVDCLYHIHLPQHQDNFVPVSTHVSPLTSSLTTDPGGLPRPAGIARLNGMGIHWESCNLRWLWSKVRTPNQRSHLNGPQVSVCSLELEYVCVYTAAHPHSD